MAAHQDVEATLLDARTQYFERNGFGSDGGYSAKCVRGRHTANLYDRDFDDTLLGRTVAQERVELGLDRDTLEHPLPATFGDHLAFIGTAMFSLSLPLGLLATAVVGISMWLS
jgi:hypothetical protein